MRMSVGLRFGYLTWRPVIEPRRFSTLAGEITTTVAEPGRFRVTVEGPGSAQNGLPAIYSFPDIDIDSTGEIGEFALPEAYPVDIRCLDDTGSPIEGLSVSFRAPNGSGISPDTFTTTEDGYVKYSNANERGLELVGEVDIEVVSVSDPEINERIRRVSVSEPAELELTVSNPGPYTSNIQKIPKDPDAGFHFPYFLYTPPTTDETSAGESRQAGDHPRPLVVGFRTFGDESERDSRVESAKRGLQRGDIRSIADELNSPAIIAPLPSSTEDGRFEVLNRDSLQISEPPYERLDLQFLSIVDDARERLADQPYEVADSVHLNGFSNNCRLSDQLAILHPERINAVTGGGDGFHTIPKRKYEGNIPVQTEPATTTLEYPVGTAGLADLVGSEFNQEAWLDTALFYYIGAEDQGDQGEIDKSTLGNEYTHAKRYAFFGRKRQQLLVDIFGWFQVDERFETTRGIFDTVGANAQFNVYEGVGHSVSDEMVTDIKKFHRRQKHETYGPQFDQQVEVPPQTVTVGETFNVGVTARNLGVNPATVTLGLAVDGETVESTDVEVQSETDESAEFEYAFSSPGEYTVELSGASAETYEVVAERQETETQQATEAEATTAQPETVSDDQPETVSDDQPGFGVVQALLASGGVGYLLKQRLSDDDD